ncbi:DNAJ heat shock N-terminal domain-containing protein [Forsythia ovata]|uniref:DNAJ heat shock N-terminal domain-containing protein n=1 Tax=Forsythia ovata TaxID=205694 RepID=A0ABD1WG87_9LAMI
MESNVEEALRFKANAEKKFAERNFVGARNYALKAQTICPELEGISQMVATFGVYIASEAKINGEFDFYSILGMDPSADKSKLKKQYKKMAVLLHPDKNKTVGADGAFRLVSEAWTHLSNSVKRSSYDRRRNLYAGHAAGAGGYDIYSKFAVSHSRLDTFWTVCTTCHVQYEYLRKYVNKRLSCKNCRGIFIAVETGVAPVNGSFSYSPSSYASENGYGSHGHGATYIPTTTGYCAPNGVSGHHTGHGAEYVSNLSFQSNSFPGYSVDVLDPNGSSTSSFIFYQANEKSNKTKTNGNHRMVKATVDIVSTPCTNYNEISRPKRGRPAKKRKVDLTSSHANGQEELSTETVIEAKMTSGNVNLKQNSKLYSPSETSIRRSSAAPPFDARQLLIDKARSEIREKLEEMRLASEAAAAEAVKGKTHTESSSEAAKISGSTGTDHQAELKRTFSMSITVPDSDFHDFDKDRSEDCFKPKQIWAVYDEEDGMPRMYCLIREVISVSPFKIHIGYLSSKTDNEFGSVNWLNSGFTKSCGNFRVYHSEIVEQVNIFSHLLGREKAGRGGCVRIYPRSGDIWALYRNWSPDWNRKTPDAVKQQYEMVEVLDNYSEELGVCVVPVIKLVGFKTVYQRNTNKDAIRWIPRREMLRFSHQVPSCLLKGVDTKLPEGCWDLDPAATPGDLLEGETEAQNNVVPNRVQNSSKTPDQQRHAETREWEEKFSQTNNFSASPDNWFPEVSKFPVVSKPSMEKRTSVKLPQAETSIKTPVELPQAETISKT